MTIFTPSQDYVGLRGEVYFPNLTFQKMQVDFGCILNDTEVTRYVEITNNSPMPVKYSRSFLEPSKPIMLYPSVIPEVPTEDVMPEGEHVMAFDDEVTEVPDEPINEDVDDGSGEDALPSEKAVVDGTDESEIKVNWGGC